MSGGAPQFPSEIDILLNEVTLPMRIEGALVLEGYLAGDEAYRDLSHSALVGMIYSRMRLAALKNQGHPGNEEKN